MPSKSSLWKTTTNREDDETAFKAFTFLLQSCANMFIPTQLFSLKIKFIQIPFFYKTLQFAFRPDFGWHLLDLLKDIFSPLPLFSYSSHREMRKYQRTISIGDWMCYFCRELFARLTPYCVRCLKFSPQCNLINGAPFNVWIVSAVYPHSTGMPIIDLNYLLLTGSWLPLIFNSAEWQTQTDPLLLVN